MKTNVNDKSIVSYRALVKSGEIGKKQQRIYKTLKELGKATNRMLANDLGWDINRVTGRITELRDKGVVSHAGDYYDRETNRTVNLWTCN